MENREIDFFISHSESVKYSIAVPLAQMLTKMGYSVWLDRKCICVGQLIYSPIIDAIRLSKYCIAIINEEYLEKTWTITELEYFHEKKDNNIIPIYVNLDRNIVCKKISWLNGIAFERLGTNNFSLKNNIIILCRIVNRFYIDHITNDLETTCEELLRSDFPCKNTLVSILNSQDYYSQDYRLAIISLCNIIDLIYAIFKSESNSFNKSMYLTHQYNNIIKKYCYNTQNNPDYNIFITTYNSTIISVKELDGILKTKQ